MTLHSLLVSGAGTAAGILAVVGLALATFLSLPETLLYNDFVFGGVLGLIILVVSAAVRVTHPDGRRSQPSGSEQ